MPVQTKFYPFLSHAAFQLALPPTSPPTHIYYLFFPFCVLCPNCTLTAFLELFCQSLIRLASSFSPYSIVKILAQAWVLFREWTSLSPPASCCSTDTPIQGNFPHSYIHLQSTVILSLLCLLCICLQSVRHDPWNQWLADPPGTLYKVLLIVDLFLLGCSAIHLDF